MGVGQPMDPMNTRLKFNERQSPSIIQNAGPVAAPVAVQALLLQLLVQ